ncbi:MAG TPA: hypothetical protein VGG27_09470 [Magnetospirillaceae bacterium]|jgi:hypothetical protein
MMGFFPSGLRRALIAAAVPVALAGCSALGGKKEAPPCPEVNVLADTSKFITYRPGPGRDMTDMVLQGEIVGYKGSCTYDKDEKKMVMTLQVSMTFTRGPAAPGDDARAEYYVAIPAYYPKPEAKQTFGVQFSFQPPADHVRITDNEVELTLPLKDPAKDLANRDIYIGFQLTPEELELNRKDKQR